MSLDKRPLLSLENTLDSLREHSIPFAVKQTLNSAAYRAYELSQKEVKSKFILRNQYTQRSLRYNKVNRSIRDIDQMYSEMGSTLEYMAKQEEGFKTEATGEHGVAIPTSHASGEGKARVRRKAILAANRLSRIRIMKGLASEYTKAYKNRQQRLLRTVQDSLEFGFRTFFWRSKNPAGTGFYRVIGGKKRTKRGWPEGAEIKMIYSVNKPIVETRSREWLRPSAERVESEMIELYRKALIRGIEKLKYR